MSRISDCVDVVFNTVGKVAFSQKRSSFGLLLVVAVKRSVTDSVSGGETGKVPKLCLNGGGGGGRGDNNIHGFKLFAS